MQCNVKSNDQNYLNRIFIYTLFSTEINNLIGFISIGQTPFSNHWKNKDLNTSI